MNRPPHLAWPLLLGLLLAGSGPSCSPGVTDDDDVGPDDDDIAPDDDDTAPDDDDTAPDDDDVAPDDDDSGLDCSTPHLQHEVIIRDVYTPGIPEYGLLPTYVSTNACDYPMEILVFGDECVGRYCQAWAPDGMLVEDASFQPWWCFDDQGPWPLAPGESFVEEGDGHVVPIQSGTWRFSCFFQYAANDVLHEVWIDVDYETESI